jgi:hypothetical protein
MLADATLLAFLLIAHPPPKEPPRCWVGIDPKGALISGVSCYTALLGSHRYMVAAWSLTAPSWFSGKSLQIKN